MDGGRRRNLSLGYELEFFFSCFWKVGAEKEKVRQPESADQGRPLYNKVKKIYGHRNTDYGWRDERHNLYCLF